MTECRAAVLVGAAFTLAAVCAGCSDDSAYAQIQAPDVSPPQIVLSAEHGGPVSVEAVCLEVVSAIAEGGRVAAYTEYNEEDLAGVLRLLGVESDSEECDLTLQVSLSGQRFSAQYEHLGPCYTGQDVWAEVAFLAADDETGRWSLHSRREPRGEVFESGCTASDVPTTGLDSSLYVEVFESLFGQPGLVAATVILAGTNTGSLPLDDDTVALLVRGWSSLDMEIRAQALWAVRYLVEDGPEANRDVLLPHLIEALAHEELEDEEAIRWGLKSELEHCLREITGERGLESAVDWWKWWEAQSD